MTDKQNDVAAINNEMDKYINQKIKIKKIIPLVAVISIASTVFFWNFKEYPVNSALGIGATLLYASIFAYGYIKCDLKIKKLKQQLKQL